MSDNSKNTSGKEANGTNYRKKSEAVERLINADKKTYPKTKTDPGKKYRSGGLIDKIPSPIKALFIKFWFNGAVCFFIYWGLGMYIWDTLDMIVILGLIMGIVTDILVNNAFRFFAVSTGDNDKWMMFPKKKFWTFFANMAYALVIMFIVAWIYNFTNILLNIISGTTDTVFIGVEPVLFGILYVAVDMLFIGMKRLIIRIVSDAKEKVESK
jgi:hypothetical protein